MTYNVNFPVRQIVVEPVNEAQVNEVPVTVVPQARKQEDEDECPRKRNRHTFVAVEDKRCTEEYDSVAICRHIYSSS